jgi:tetratricopeptide (TPR) repeat protein
MNSARLTKSFLTFAKVAFLIGASLFPSYIHAQDASSDPEATLRHLLDVGERSKNVKEALEALLKAQQLVETSDQSATFEPRYRIQVKLLLSLGRRYRQLRSGVRSDNLEHAITSFRSALAILDPGDRALWISTQYNLGMSFVDRIRGNRADNIEEAIEHFEAAVSASSKEREPDEWAIAQRGIARAYQTRIYGSRSDNLERALAGYKASLDVTQAYTDTWARTQSYLGDLLVVRIHGERASNLEQAIKAYNAALIVRTFERSSELWASTLFGLGRAFAERIEGDRSENIERAIASYKAALTVRSETELPRPWAATQINLGNAYRLRIRGTSTENVELAIDAYKSALRVYTAQTNPHQWAMANENLGTTLSLRAIGDPSQNLEEAIRVYHDALTVLTPDAYPRDYLVTARGLAHAHLLKRDWWTAHRTYDEVISNYRVMFSEIADDEAEAAATIRLTGSTFNEAAYVATMLGDPDSAFALLNEGKARVLSAAMRDMTSSLPAAVRARREAIVTEMRTWARVAETDEGPVRVEAIDKVVSLRKALRELVDTHPIESNVAKQEVKGLLDEILVPGRAIVAPIVTDVGAKIVIALNSGAPERVHVLDIPELTTKRLNQYLYGSRTDVTGGWIASYFGQYKSSLPSQRTDVREWLKAVENLGPSLWSLFIGQTDAELRKFGLKDGDQIVWVPTEALGILPIGLARDAASGGEFGRSFVIVYAPNLNLIAWASEYIAKQPEPSLAAVVNPTGNIPSLNLPFADFEGRFAESLFRKDRVIELDQENATEPAVIDALKNSTYWHFASHGSFNWTDGRHSSLILKDEARLSVGDLIDALGNVGRPRLVVLSACETGLYDSRQNADEFVGLPAAFMRLGSAGVRGSCNR